MQPAIRVLSVRHQVDDAASELDVAWRRADFCGQRPVEHFRRQSAQPERQAKPRSHLRERRSGQHEPRCICRGAEGDARRHHPDAGGRKAEQRSAKPRPCLSQPPQSPANLTAYRRTSIRFLLLCAAGTAPSNFHVACSLVLLHSQTHTPRLRGISFMRTPGASRRVSFVGRLQISTFTVIYKPTACHGIAAFAAAEHEILPFSAPLTAARSRKSLARANRLEDVAIATAQCVPANVPGESVWQTGIAASAPTEPVVQWPRRCRRRLIGAGAHSEVPMQTDTKDPCDDALDEQALPKSSSEAALMPDEVISLMVMLKSMTIYELYHTCLVEHVKPHANRYLKASRTRLSSSIACAPPMAF